MNNVFDWSNSKNRLRQMIGDSYNGLPISYDNAINPSDGVLGDLIRVFQQKMAEDKTLSWEAVAKVVLLFNGVAGNLGLYLYNKINQIVTDIEIKFLPDRIAELRQKFEKENSYADQYVARHMKLYKDYINVKKRKVLLVAHSQGNLYANASYKKLYQDPEIITQSFNLVGVASPANYVAGNAPYLTSSRDLVINGLRYLVASDTLPGNIELPYTIADVKGHGFLEIYTNLQMNGFAQVKALINRQLNTLEDPPLGGWYVMQHYEYKKKIEPSGSFCPTTWETHIAGQRGTAGYLLYGIPMPGPSTEYFNAQGKAVPYGEIFNVVGTEYMTAINDLRIKYDGWFYYQKNTDCKGATSEAFIPMELQQRDVKFGVDNYIINPALKKLSAASNIWVSRTSDWPNKTLKISICSKQ